MQLVQSFSWFKSLCAGAALALALLACGGGGGNDPPGRFNQTGSQATLTGDQEVVLPVTGAVGSGSLALTSPSLAISGGINFNGMVATAAHIHLGDAGASGPVIVTLVQSSAGVWSVPTGATLTQAQAQAFVAGGLYFNVHSTAYPDGEIRGQIGRDVLIAQMTGTQEVPSNNSSATGNGFVSLDPVTKKFSARVSVVGMAATATHIHTGAQGSNGPVLFTLSELSPGVWVAGADAIMNDAQIAALKAGGLYFNVHSSAFPGGQLRGQIGRNVRFANLNGAQEVPPVATAGTGTGTLVVDPVTRVASGGISITGVVPTGAHIHVGASGVDGPIVVTLVNAGGGSWTVPAGTLLTADQVRAYKQGGLYFNVHSINHQDGEIRGQIL